MSVEKICHVEEEQSSGDVDQKIDLINTLSYDALAKIFMQLPIHERIVMDQVCSKWKEASKLAWYDIKKYKCTSTSSTGLAYDKRLLIQSDVEKILLHCGIYLKELSLSRIRKSSILPIIGDHCKNLTRLEFGLSEYHMNTNNINYFVQVFRQLDKLKVVRIQVYATYDNRVKKFSIEIIDSLSEGIDEIHIFFPKVLENTLPFFFNLKKFKNLHSLTLSRCVIDDMIAEISEKQSLVYLNLEKSKTITGDLIFMFNRLVNLEHIKITSYLVSPTNSPGLLCTCISNTCKNLKHLEISTGFYNSIDVSIINWANLKNLVFLNIFWKITDEVAIKIVNYCKNLVHLCISRYSDTTETALKKLTKLENLETFKLEFLQLNSRVIIAISNNCEKLKHLSILGCTVAKSIDDGETRSSASALDDLSKLQYLEHLELTGIKDLQDSTIIAIANKCKNLKYLGIGDCQDITETALMALTSMENLKKLEIRRNPNVTNNFIVKLKGLKLLNCKSCEKLTDAGLIQFIKNCPDLEDLIIDVTNITKDFENARNKLNKNRIFDIRVKI
ncbi:F-box/LRR-repeat protein 2-like [Aphidius gifuensis]|uniref:F-box/LRR-repeat protein 2-like n=1 Tax=Aphidius gifuensis TaxID=684658 RepID=UPI001CDD7745|nr:F-box/LRR-repeat protein 2-like [Aphidius gifuensis]